MSAEMYRGLRLLRMRSMTSGPNRLPNWNNGGPKRNDRS